MCSLFAAAGNLAPAQNFSLPKLLQSNGAFDSAYDSSPVLASDGGDHWIAVWEREGQATEPNLPDMELMYAVSSNGGTSWSGPAALDSSAFPDSGADASPAIAFGNGVWIVVYESLPGSNTVSISGPDLDINYARSIDNGATWSPATQLHTSMLSDAGDDASPRIAADGAGNWVVVWDSNDTLGVPTGTIPFKDHDIFFSRSADDGLTWSAPAALNSDAASTTTRAVDLAPDIATNGSVWIATWHATGHPFGAPTGSDPDIFFARSIDAGMTWSDPGYINSGAEMDNAVFGDPKFLVMDTFPSIAAGGPGKWVAVWESRHWQNFPHMDPEPRKILYSQSLDDGVTWSVSMTVDESSEAISRDSIAASLAADDDGNWRAVWNSADLTSPQVRDAIYTSEFNETTGEWSAVGTITSSEEGSRGAWPSIARGGDRWIASWETREESVAGLGEDGDIAYSIAAPNRTRDWHLYE